MHLYVTKELILSGGMFYKITCVFKFQEDAEHYLAIKKARVEETKKLKDQLVAKLGNKENKENFVNVNALKPLSEAMTVEKIAAIKVKRLAKKRTMIKGYDDINQDDVEMVSLESQDLLEDMSKRERRYRDRTTILRSGGKVLQIDLL